MLVSYVSNMRFLFLLAYFSLADATQLRRWARDHIDNPSPCDIGSDLCTRRCGQDAEFSCRLSLNGSVLKVLSKCECSTCITNACNKYKRNCAEKCGHHAVQFDCESSFGDIRARNCFCTTSAAVNPCRSLQRACASRCKPKSFEHWKCFAADERVEKECVCEGSSSRVVLYVALGVVALIAVVVMLFVFWRNVEQ